eukprot:CAMPEP_0205801438 /NCGR_PEP_ID=MMETSP0205-20121125/3430_1 /ASSEMBLY_ACC=CAM_ASM_000278 /TAXON_ID=36767 /ORGANISM="Euplotes focardii, Strain TN1" /LENGTH=97 /DNA_ID=CAMNT_0053066193 /DNA_START=747 /DNA_END=1037 /DNA_ORIENTATION=-
MKKNRANWEGKIGEYQDRMIVNINRIHNANEVIQEAKSESEESSESNKLSSFLDSSPNNFTVSGLDEGEGENDSEENEEIAEFDVTTPKPIELKQKS